MLKDEFGFWHLKLKKDIVPHGSMIKLYVEGADGVFRDKISPWVTYSI